MTLMQAIEHFFSSGLYREKAKAKGSEGGVLRNNKSRHEKGKLGNISAIAMLRKYGYTVREEYKVTPPKKKSK